MRRLTTLALAFALTAVACGGGGTEGEAASSPDASPSASEQLVAQVASYDIAVSEGERRVIVGLLTGDNRLVVSGEVEMAFSYLGEGEGPVGSPEPGPETAGTFLPLPGQEADDGAEGPRVVQPSEMQGVYAAEASFDRAGIWRVEVTADVEEIGEGAAVAHFEVSEETQVPVPGEEAPVTENLTVDSDAPPVAIDSRAQGDGEVPDPELHSTTIADAISEGRPLLVIFSTPVYCVSRFCGPITEMVEDLEEDHGDEMAFVHVEVWQDFQEKTLNDAAQEWIGLPDGNLQEPWVFLVDGDGEITARWDNVATRGEIEPEITELLAG